MTEVFFEKNIKIGANYLRFSEPVPPPRRGSLKWGGQLLTELLDA